MMYCYGEIRKGGNMSGLAIGITGGNRCSGGVVIPPTIHPLTITENGVHHAPSGVDGYNPVTVDVQPPPPAGEWDDLIAIWEANKNANSRIMLVLSDSLPTFVFNQSQLGNSGCTYRTSDGATYNANATHTWDTAQDIQRRDKFIRWIMVDSNNANVSLNVANTTNNSVRFAYMGNNAVMQNVIFGYTAENSCKILEAILNDGQITAASASIGNSAFSGCRSLQSVVIPNGVTSIGNSVFYGCNSLQSVVIPNGVISIGNSVFYDCNSLQSVVIPNGVTSIGGSVFSGCNSLQSVVIPNGFVFQGNIIFTYSPLLPERAVQNLGTNLGITGTPRILAFNTVLQNRFSPATWALFTSKGYTIAFAS